MTHYLITNTTSGANLGVYEGADEDEALDAMARDAGYSDYEAACEVSDDMGVNVVAVEMYEAVRYAADGHSGEINPTGDSDNEVICTGTLEECRDAISQRIGQMDGRRWDGGDNDVEAYHDSDEEGCGGYAIRKMGDDETSDD